MDRPQENQSSRLRPCEGAPAKDIAGRFRCDELDAELAVADAGGVLYGGFSGFLGQGRMELLGPVGADVWVLPCPRALDHTPPGDWTLAFRRDGAGRVAGVKVGCWLARRLEYTRRLTSCKDWSAMTDFENAVITLTRELVSLDSRSFVSNLAVAERVEAALRASTSSGSTTPTMPGRRSARSWRIADPSAGSRCPATWTRCPTPDGRRIRGRRGWIADGVLHGLGSTDMKGPVAAAIVAACALPASGRSPC